MERAGEDIQPGIRSKRVTDSWGDPVGIVWQMDYSQLQKDYLQGACLALWIKQHFRSFSFAFFTTFLEG
jgi:hypothetical protein